MRSVVYVPEMSDARLDEIDRRLGAGGGYTGAPTKQELRAALIELVDEVRRRRRAERDAIPATLFQPDQADLEDENRRLWERAAQADYEAARANLRASILHLVLQSALLTFPRRSRLRKRLRSRWVPATTLARWQRICDDKGYTAEQALIEAGNPRLRPEAGDADG
jgi:crotonobetainyl-CoA:carnitine CoA-transferase CaiB-like acyl-CoA transferase